MKERQEEFEKNKQQLELKLLEKKLRAAEAEERFREEERYLQLQIQEDQDPLRNKRTATCGRKRALNEENVEELSTFVRENPFSSLATIKERMNLPCSKWTIRRRLVEANFKNRRPAQNVDLTNLHRQRRLEFAEANLNRDWANVIFSDEKVFSTDVGSGSITLSLWGWMSSAGPGELVRTSPHMDSAEYIGILENTMLPSVRAVYGEMNPILFVQDNSAAHKSRLVKEWFRQNSQIVPINWPPKSPDLNPIENLWAATSSEDEKEETPFDDVVVEETDVMFLKHQGPQNEIDQPVTAGPSTGASCSTSSTSLDTAYKLRLNTPYHDISQRFNCSVATVTNIFMTWLYLLHEVIFEGLISEVPGRAKNFACSPVFCSIFKHKNGDLVIAEKGFLISDLLPPGVTLNSPPFPEQVAMTTNIARAGIHVEQAIRRIEAYRILKLCYTNIDDAPPGSIGFTQESGWMVEELFPKWLRHFVKHFHASPQNMVLLILKAIVATREDIDLGMIIENDLLIERESERVNLGLRFSNSRTPNVKNANDLEETDVTVTTVILNIMDEIANILAIEALEEAKIRHAAPGKIFHKRDDPFETLPEQQFLRTYRLTKHLELDQSSGLEYDFDEDEVVTTNSTELSRRIIDAKHVPEVSEEAAQAEIQGDIVIEEQTAEEKRQSIENFNGTMAASSLSVGSRFDMDTNCGPELHIQDSIEMKKEERRFINFKSNENGTAIVKRHDNSIVSLASNGIPVHPLHPNRKMGGVHRADHNTSLYRVAFRGKKWYIPLIFHMLGPSCTKCLATPQTTRCEVRQSNISQTNCNSLFGRPLKKICEAI
ncbi:hypothetical protein ILUMI_06781 [Ignelater luminosus]|uniref:Transposase n=1 Tax=Ignelater luminosus TaxID=2038154 RepID=A0A8K0D537_IGNLU|nr:hypothetical protein ILUMI_06781 [Ignelater luminosus]